VLEWVFRRCDDATEAHDTPIGRMPAPGAINIEGLDVSDADLAELLSVNAQEWQAQLPQFREHLAQFDRLPQELNAQLDALEKRLGEATQQ
jgi:phosphoenolpyruvate carboxykinase (GTP)